MPREEADFLCFLHRALGLYVKPPDRFNFVVEEVEAEGALRPHREDVDDAPANGEFAGGKNLLHGGVAREREALLNCADRNALAFMKEEGARTNVGDRCHSLRRRDRGSKEHIRASRGSREAVERFKALGNEVFLGRENVVGERFPVGERPDIQFGLKPGKLGREPRHIRRIRADDENAHALRLHLERGAGNRRGVACLGGDFEPPANAGFDGGKIFLEEDGRVSHGMTKRRRKTNAKARPA